MFSLDSHELVSWLKRKGNLCLHAWNCSSFKARAGLLELEVVRASKMLCAELSPVSKESILFTSRANLGTSARATTR
jgi:hypothetical protein